jgi:catechol 2,3-dioxygenase-like lactoylglutathione lyase family enzyme
VLYRNLALLEKRGFRAIFAMLDHLSLGVSDLARSIAFYDAALGALGYVRLWANERAAGYAPPGARDEPFAIKLSAPAPRAREGASAVDSPVEAVGAPRAGWHVAFKAASRAAVDAFFAAALATGGADEGGPGLRPHYGPGYYAAFVRDPDGTVLEAVLHE